ncbi:MAG: phage holin family protein [Pseudomonadota bacterium]
MMIVNILLLSVAVFVVSTALPGVRLKSYWTALGVAVVYSVINFFVGWLLVFLSFPFIVVTFGLFLFVINALLLWITDKLIDDFEIDNFGVTLLAAFLITLVNGLLKWIF